MKVVHTLEPVYDENSKVLILGSMPSVKSREFGFYYAHPMNRFWKILEKVFKEQIGEFKEEKVIFLKKQRIALYDVIKSCDINGSSDNSIKNVIPNDLVSIIKNSNIKTIFTTGIKAYQLYQKYCYKDTMIEAIPLPSSSGANCKKGMEEELYNKYCKIRGCIEEVF